MYSVSKILRCLFDICKDDKNGLNSGVWRERQRQGDGDRKRNTERGVVCMVCERGKVIFACLVGGKCLSVFLCVCVRVHRCVCVCVCVCVCIV